MKEGYFFKKEWKEYIGEFLKDKEKMREEHLKEIEDIVVKQQNKLHELEKMKGSIKYAKK